MSEYFNNIFTGLKSFVEGLQLTMHHFRNRKDLVATLQYPHEKWPIQDRYIGFPLEEYNIIRSRLNVDIDDCIGCLQCERACPVDCIKIETIKPPKGSDFDCGVTSNGTKKKMLVTRFSIDMTECMFCNLCTYPCPEDCIYMVGGPNSSKHEIEYEYASHDRESLIFQFSNPSESDIIAVGGEDYLRMKKGLPPIPPPEPVKRVETKIPVAEKQAPGAPDVKVLNGITNRMVRATAKKAFMAAVRTGKSISEIAVDVKAALESADKL
ncbi:MAG: 4Fe-4S binding protein, partial [Fidelibacterota bacterium]